ncbi:ankyrin repeat domain-containing protein [Nodosilinea sp. FACHB-13]|uniref:ankyrin repeat domain-containing protein n=1 Tax=Cyanophyceae TaxID=3028117 RepID=UPI001681F703|nr:ankyrin repeat domain-containing protein [Nodosilinea sp. FACHB-13]MBD2106819.1 hypothetical protein [Nodosilinea sp. FACHB-13]
MARSPLPFWQIPLFCAVADDSADQVALLLADGADPNLQDEGGRRPLMQVCSTAVASLLLEAGAQVHSCDDNNNDAFQHLLAREVGFNFPNEAALLEVLHLLIAHGADPNSAQCWENRTRLYDAAFNEVIDYASSMIQRLLQCGSDPHWGRSPLEGLCSRWNREFDQDIVRSFDLLLEAGCDPKLRGEEGLTLLHLAVAEDWTWNSLGPNYTAMRCLLNSGADPNAVNDEGWTPLMGAVRAYVYDVANVSLVEDLIEAGTNLALQNAEGHTALDIALTALDTCQRLYLRDSDPPELREKEKVRVQRAVECVELLRTASTSPSRPTT